MRTTSTLKKAGALVVALWAAGAWADERLEARRHFRLGMSLIASGQFDAGVRELQEAYATKPHPSVLYNIARAYLDAGRVPEAVEWYKRYLGYNPPDAATVRATVARLEASVKPAEAPAEAQAAAPKATTGDMPPPPAGYRPVVGGMSAEKAAQLEKLLERLEKAITRAEEAQQGTDSAAPAEAAGVLAMGAATQPGHLAQEDLEAAPYEERVVTASRRAQSSLEAPNAMTVITAEDIRLSGATNLYELLRRVPGADVMAMGVGSANVSFRGFNQRLANKVLVLVDGRTEYQDFLGLTLWSALPVGVDEIERIEVIRGPGSALYGANAMLGVVNIITRAPGTGPAATFRLVGGMGNSAQGDFVAHGGNGPVRYRASAGYGQADKWSNDYAEGRADITRTAPFEDLALRSARANVTTVYTPGKGVEAGLSAGVNKVYTELYPPGLLRNFYLDGLSAYTKADLTFGPFKLKGFWNHLTADAGNQYAPVGQSDLRTRLSNNTLNGEALFTTSFQAGGNHTLNAGAEGRFKNLRWDYLGGKRQELHLAAFVQEEYQPFDPLRLVVSYRVDQRNALKAGDRLDLAHSPRASANLMIAPGHAVRASYATAFREATFLESYTQLRVPVPGVNGASALTVGDEELKPERMEALELGYRGEAPELGIDWDLAIYQNRVHDLIGLSSLTRLPADQTFDTQSGTYLAGRSSFQNEPDVYTARGAEVGVNLSPIDGLGVKASSALQQVVNNEDTVVGQCGPCSQSPLYRGFLGVTYRTRSALEFGVDAAYTGRTTWIEREPGATDPTQVNFVANPLKAYLVLNARVGIELVKDHVELGVVGTHLGAAHQEHPFGNFIERRIYATLTVTP